MALFQCPLSGQLCCRDEEAMDELRDFEFQCPLSGQLCCCPGCMRPSSQKNSFNAL